MIADRKNRLGFADSLALSGKIVRGSFSLLRQYPVLAVPLLPVLVLVLLLEAAALFWTSPLGLGLFMLAVFFIATCLMLSFAVCGQMLKHIEAGDKPSLRTALSTPAMLPMIPRVLGLSAVWYSLVLILVTVEMILSALLSRLSDDLSDRVLGSIFGTMANALRMAGFMIVAIMTFEDVGLVPAFRRLRAVLKAQTNSALGGLVLTKVVTSVIALVLYGITWLLAESNLGGLALAALLPLAAMGWLLAMYLEQLFVTGLYRYSAAPDSALVKILLGDVLGCELPATAARPRTAM